MSAMTDEATTLDDVDEALRHAWATGDRAYIDRLLDLRITLS